MATGDTPPEPCRDELLAEVKTLRQKVEELEQEKQD